MRTQPKRGEEPRREPGCRRHPQPAAPSSHPEAGAGKSAPASQEEQWPHPIPPRAASRFHPAEDKACGPWLACGKAGSAGPHPARRAKAVIHIPPAMNHRCPCAPTDPSAAETMRAMLAGSGGGRGHRAPSAGCRGGGLPARLGVPNPERVGEGLDPFNPVQPQAEPTPRGREAGEFALQ